MSLLGQLPPHFFEVGYVGQMTPGVDPGVDLSKGANCQRFAYAVLREFGTEIPPFRSDELAADKTSTESVDHAQPLDLMLFAGSEDPYGAHVGVCIGDDAVLHLCAEPGRPVVWTLEEFEQRPRYRNVVAIKRPIRSSG